MPSEYRWSGLAQVFCFLALLGFITSLIVHVAGLMGEDNPFTWNLNFLHFGVFVVCFPAALLSKQLNSRHHKEKALENILRGCPSWMQRGMYIVFAYGLLNFVVFSVLKETGIKEGSMINASSGHWLIFYYASFALLYSYTQVAKNEVEL